MVYVLHDKIHNMNNKKIPVIYPCETITRKDIWQLQIFDDRMVSSWRDEELSLNPKFGDEFDHIISMLRVTTKGKRHLDTCEWGDNDELCSSCLEKYNNGDFDDGFYDWAMINCCHEPCTCSSADFSVNEHVIADRCRRYSELEGKTNILRRLTLEVTLDKMSYNFIEALFKNFIPSIEKVLFGKDCCIQDEEEYWGVSYDRDEEKEEDRSNREYRFGSRRRRLWNKVKVILDVDCGKHENTLVICAYCVDGECYIDFHKRIDTENGYMNRYLGIVKCTPGDFVVFDKDLEYRVNSGESEMLFFHVVNNDNKS